MIAAVKELLKRPVSFHPVLARVGGSVNAGLFLGQLIYWLQKNDGEWNWKTAREWEEETCLSIKEQRNARAAWKRLGVLRERPRGGYNRTLEYAIDWPVLVEKVQMHVAQRANGTRPKGRSKVPKGQDHLQETPSETPSETPRIAETAPSEEERETTILGTTKSKHQILMALAKDLHVDVTKKNPVISGRDGASLKRLLEQHGAEECRAMIESLANANRTEKAAYWKCGVSWPALETRWNALQALHSNPKAKSYLGRQYDIHPEDRVKGSPDDIDF